MRRAAPPFAAVQCAATSTPRFCVPRHFSASIPYPTTPHSKTKLEAKRERPVRNWRSVNAPSLVPKFLRFAERQARELGVADDIAAFDEAAAAFPNPCAIVTNTLLERPALVMRDVESWESDFLEYAEARRHAEAKPYPQTLIDMFTASSTVLEGAGRGADAAAAGGGSEASPGSDAAGGDGTTASSGSDTGAASLAASSGARLDDFYEAGGDGGDADAADARAGLVLAPRATAADALGDVRSLDRAYSARLLLLLRDARSGTWTLPGGPRLEGERMVAAAERTMRSAWGAPSSSPLDAWYVGAAPVGHWLEVFPEEVQAATGAYGAKHFVYRAELLGGKLARPGAGFDEWAWVTRDEAEERLPRPLWKYLHQVAGAGPGEEFARRAAWQRRVAAAGLTPAQASGRSAYRLAAARRTGAARLPAVATRAQAELTAAPHGDAAKSAALAKELAAYAARVRLQRADAALVADRLATPTAAAARAARQRASAGSTAAVNGAAQST